MIAACECFSLSSHRCCLSVSYILTCKIRTKRMNHFCVCVCIYIDFIRLFFPYVTFVFVYGRERKNDDVLLREKKKQNEEISRFILEKKRRKRHSFFLWSYRLRTSFCYLKRSCPLQNNGHTGKYSKRACVHSERHIILIGNLIEFFA